MFPVDECTLRRWRRDFLSALTDESWEVVVTGSYIFYPPFLLETPAGCFSCSTLALPVAQVSVSDWSVSEISMCLSVIQMLWESSQSDPVCPRWQAHIPTHSSLLLILVATVALRACQSIKEPVYKISFEKVFECDHTQGQTSFPTPHIIIHQPTFRLS